MIRRRTGQQGFSLVEILIAMFVLLVGILAVLVLFPLGVKESKTVMDESTAAIVARNARGLMETYPFKYNNSARIGQGIASLIQAMPKYGPRGTTSNFNNFPVMFPGDVLQPGSSFFDDCITTDGSRVIEMQKVPGNNPPSPSQYSWDARFTIGGGPGADAPPVNLPVGAGGPQPTWGTANSWMFNGQSLMPPPGTSGSASGWADYYWGWFSQYFKYYAVQISIYRNYQQIIVGQGTISLKADPNYDPNDPNRPTWSELAVTGTPDVNLTAGSYIRVLDSGIDGKSDWYKITNVSYQGGAYAFRLDRPYWGLYQIQQNSKAYNNIIATNSLIESFTTILGSQLDDVDSSTISYP